jgi:pimeloyl-ACP methyl ester carboxylesterase
MTGTKDGAVFALNDMSAYSLNMEGVSIIPFKEDGINGFHMTPRCGKCAKGVIVEFGGSENGCNFLQATELALHGYEVFALYYFGTEKQPPVIHMIALEYFEKFIGLLKKKGISYAPLTIIGASRGAEFALVLADKYPDIIKHIVLYAPASYSLQGTDTSTTASSWSFSGKELPYIPLDLVTWSIALKEAESGKPINFRNVYLASIDNAKNREEAKIDFSHYKGDALVFAGKDDKVWHSATMAEDITKCMGARASAKIYPNTGHLFIESTLIDTPFFTMLMGGTEKSNIAAKEDSDKILLEKLSEWHL